MTNGEKIKEIFSNFRVHEMSHTIVVGNGSMSFKRDWWNAEYKDPTTQERQAESDKFDAAFQDGYNNGYAQARFDYEQEPTTRNDLEVISKRKELAEYIRKEFAEAGIWAYKVDTINMRLNFEMLDIILKALDQEPTIKNDLAVDCISRAEMLRYQEYLHGKMSN